MWTLLLLLLLLWGWGCAAMEPCWSDAGL